MKIKLVNVVLFLCSFLFCFLLAELYFRFVHIESDGLGLTLSNKKWGQKYWKPINSLGLRDREWTKADLEGKYLIAVVGGSFVTGHGIKNVENRFSDVLAKKLGSQYAVINISNPGWGTLTELVFLRNYPSMFNTVIWSYFPNDIIETCSFFSKFPPDVVTQPTGAIEKIINSSYFINYVYWNLYRIIKLKNEYFQWIKEQYNDPRIFNTHLKELELINEFAKNKGANLTVLLFPFLTKEVKSDLILNQVKEHLLSRNISVIDVSDFIFDMKESDIIVSKIDAHPSVKLHKIVGDKLYDYLINDMKIAEAVIVE